MDELFGIEYRLLFGGDRDDPVVVIGSETNPNRHPPPVRVRVLKRYGPDDHLNVVTLTSAILQRNYASPME